MLRVVELLARIETGVALRGPSDPLPAGALDALERAAGLMLPAEPPKPDSAAFAAIFRDWESAVLNGLRAMVGSYDRLAPAARAAFWCAVATVPQPAGRRLELPEDRQDHEARRTLRLALAEARASHPDEAEAIELAFAPLFDPSAPDPGPGRPLESAAAACIRAQRARLDKLKDDLDAMRARMSSQAAIDAITGDVAPTAALPDSPGSSPMPSPDVSAIPYLPTTLTSPWHGL